jgi:hypothetical protein
MVRIPDRVEVVKKSLGYETAYRDGYRDHNYHASLGTCEQVLGVSASQTN